MITHIRYKNFGPFRDEIYFTTQSDKAKKKFLNENTVLIKENYYNKVNYVFGPNGAGKSNFFRGINSMRNLVALSQILIGELPNSLNKVLNDIYSDNNHFQFNNYSCEEESEFEIACIIKNIEYTYSFSIKDKKVTKEKLIKKNKRSQVILNRTSEKYTDIEVSSEMKAFKDHINVVKENSLCLSMAAFLNNELAKNIIEYLTKNITVINMAFPPKPNFDDFDYKRYHDKFLKHLQVADPTLSGIDVTIEEKDVDTSDSQDTDFENKEVMIRMEIDAYHDIYDENNIKVNTKNLPFQLQSLGTIKFFSLLSFIFQTLDKGGVLLIDEIDNGIHPSLLKYIIDLFNNQYINENKAILICSLHTLSILKDDVRKDQVWFFDKDNYGVSKLYNLSKFPVKTNDNLYKKYMEGIFGGIPKMNTLEY
ncbi:MAG: ATP-binding protein [Clostridia bacterium]|nr:ATP-binding protein [Clostridia bacterium]